MEMHEKPRSSVGWLLMPILLIFLTGCAGRGIESAGINLSSSIAEENKESTELNSEVGKDLQPSAKFTKETKIWDVIDDPAFRGYGRLLFPLEKPIDKDMPLGHIGRIMTWYNYVNPNRTVDIVNTLHTRAENGEKIFYEIYTNEEKKQDAAKANTGLFFFRGNPGAKSAIVNAGGGFVYVGAMHDSFPQALVLSRMGYNAFALIYRPGAQTACEDLARAVAFLHEHAEELQIDMTDYSLWGGSAGARMANWVGTYGTGMFGQGKYLRPSAVIMQYTGMSEVTGREPPTYACVGTGDRIADYRVVQQRIKKIQANGVNATVEIFPELPHGFGLGEGTAAEGWIQNAVNFWRANMRSGGVASK